METKEVITFKSADGRYEFHVRPEFLKRCPVPTDYNIYDLNGTYHLAAYLHNPNGPALVDSTNGAKLFFVNGKHVSGEDALKLEHDGIFNDAFNDMLNEEDPVDVVELIEEVTEQVAVDRLKSSL